MDVQVFQDGKGNCGGGCGGGGKTLILQGTVSKAMLAAILKDTSFNEVEYQTKAGILYVESKSLLITGPFGRNRLQVKCKFAIPARTELCDQQVASLIQTLKGL